MTLQQKVLPFWKDHARVWFTQFEAIVGSYRPRDETKYRLVLSVLQQPEIEQVTDILINPPESNKYEVLKSRFISVYEVSETRQFQKLLNNVQLGDNKPSQLLRIMRDLAASNIPDDALRIMWMGHLPTQVRAVLSISTEPDLNVLASMADKMMEHTNATVAAISHPKACSNHCDSPAEDKLDLLLTELNKMKLEVAELRRERARSPHRSAGPRWQSRSRSRSSRRPRHYGGPTWLCRYHFTYGDNAQCCEEPCAKAKGAEN